MSKRSVRKVRHYAPTIPSFKERTAAGQEDIRAIRLWRASVPRLAGERKLGEMIVENTEEVHEDFLDEVARERTEKNPEFPELMEEAAAEETVAIEEATANEE